MRYTPELAARAETWLALPLEQKRGGDGSGLVELATIWAAIQGLPLPECLRQCQYSERAQSVAAYVQQYHRFILTPDAMSDTKYSFAPEFASETISDGRYTKNVTAENLTDDDAKALLKLGYGHVIKEKGKGEQATDATSADEAGAKPSAAEKKAAEGQKKAEAAAEKHKQEVADSKKALKAEEDAHAATHKELTDTKKVLAGVQKQLAEALAKLDKPAEPAKDADAAEAK